MALRATPGDGLIVRVLLTIHHILDENSGAPGSAMAIRDTLESLGHCASILSYDALPRCLRGRIAELAFPLLVAWTCFRKRREYDIVDGASADASLASLLPRRLRPRVMAFRTHGLEHFAHEHFLEQCRRGLSKRSWKYYLFRGSIQLAMIASAARRADVRFFLNPLELEFAARRLRVPVTRSYAMGQGIPQYLVEKGPPSNGNPSKAMNVAFIGMFITRKGIDFMLPALESHLRTHAGSRVLLLGTKFDQSVVLHGFSQDLKERVAVVPDFDRHHLPALLSNSHIFLLPSLSEGFGKAALEAMACGLVPVVTKGHGFDQFVTHEVNGLLVPPASSTAIADALSRLVSDPALWNRLRKEALASAREHTWERVVQKRVAAYQEVHNAL
jgi:glycosyltransferase involved in cell wall biosynthesis